MNKLNKILLVLVVLLTIALITMTILFFNMKKLANSHYSMYESQKELSSFLEQQLEERNQE
jgi:competence protein ComGF